MGNVKSLLTGLQARTFILGQNSPQYRQECAERMRRFRLRAHLLTDTDRRGKKLSVHLLSALKETIDLQKNQLEDRKIKIAVIKKEEIKIAISAKSAKRPFSRWGLWRCAYFI